MILSIFFSLYSSFLVEVITHAGVMTIMSYNLRIDKDLRLNLN